MQFSKDVQYALTVSGGALWFGVFWWVMCFILRNGIDGTRAAVKAINRRDWKRIRRIFLNGWRTMRDYEPIRPHQPGVYGSGWNAL
jgi:hypothetical protein